MTYGNIEFIASILYTIVAHQRKKAREKKLKHENHRKKIEELEIQVGTNYPR